MESLIGKTVRKVSTITHYSTGSFPETSPLLEMTDGTRYFFNGSTWECMSECKERMRASVKSE